MKWSYALASVALFLISLLFLALLTLFESMLVKLSLSTERVISAFLLVLPGVVGVLLGFMSLFRNERTRWMAMIGIILNGLFATFQIFVLSFAG